jgi:predicted nucleotidyltransferase
MSKKFNLSKCERKALNQFIKMVKKDWPNTRFKIFGSKVKGIEDAESDLDLLILLPCEVTSEIRRKIIHKVFDINLEYGSNISVLILSDKEWNNAPLSLLPIHEVIEKEGIPL